mmetsp:Transcript_11533/g.24658  ORF Transcript_11533/g.24658 Transcript_11533/m.24658 type:complete len:226 (+) Transcript_11533:255-932(+)
MAVHNNIYCINITKGTLDKLLALFLLFTNSSRHPCATCGIISWQPFRCCPTWRTWRTCCPSPSWRTCRCRPTWRTWWSWSASRPWRPCPPAPCRSSNRRGARLPSRPWTSRLRTCYPWTTSPSSRHPPWRPSTWDPSDRNPCAFSSWWGFSSSWIWRICCCRTWTTWMRRRRRNRPWRLWICSRIWAVLPSRWSCPAWTWAVFPLQSSCPAWTCEELPSSREELP